MNYIEIIIAFGLMLVAWAGAEIIARFGDYEPAYFAMQIDASDDPVISRTCPHSKCARTGLIYSGTFAIRAHSIFDDEGNEWAEIQISPFSPHYVWIPVDLRKMSTTFVKRGRIVGIGADEIMAGK